MREHEKARRSLLSKDYVQTVLVHPLSHAVDLSNATAFRSEACKYGLGEAVFVESAKSCCSGSCRRLHLNGLSDTYQYSEPAILRC